MGAIVGLTWPILVSLSPDSVLDIASLAFDIMTGNWTSFKWDLVSLLLPGVFGLGYADEAYDAYRVYDRVDNFSDTTRYGDDIVGSLPASCNSFSADTEVATKDGDKSISEIKIGDFVLAWNEETHELSFERVTDTIHHTDEVVVHLTIDGEELETTPEHPFYVEGTGWVNAKELKVGDDIRKADSKTGKVESITTEETSQEMYNLTVDEAHTFFVGDGQWLVHNVDCVDLINRFSSSSPADKLNIQNLLNDISMQRAGSVLDRLNISIPAYSNSINCVGCVNDYFASNRYPYFIASPDSAYNNPIYESLTEQLAQTSNVSIGDLVSWQVEYKLPFLDEHFRPISQIDPNYVTHVGIYVDNEFVFSKLTLRDPYATLSFDEFIQLYKQQRTVKFWQVP